MPDYDLGRLWMENRPLRRTTSLRERLPLSWRGLSRSGRDGHMHSCQERQPTVRCTSRCWRTGRLHVTGEYGFLRLYLALPFYFRETKDVTRRQ